jgi:hypothetical protein
MSSHCLQALCTSSTDYVFSLAPAGSSVKYLAGSVKVRAVQSGGAAAGFIVTPIVVAEGASVPAASTQQVSLSTPGASLLLNSTNNPAVLIGQPQAKGFTKDAQGAPVATHLLVTCTAAGVLQMDVDSNDT